MDDITFDLGFDMSDLADVLGDAARTETADQLPAPVRHDRRGIERREYINGLRKQALTELITELPPPNVDLYILSNGSGGTYKPSQQSAQAFEFGHFIPVLVDMLGGQGCTAYCSTWTMNRSHALNMLDMLDTGELASLAVMTDPYFLRRESAVANTLVIGLRERGQRFVAFKNHVKALAIASADGQRVVTVTGSANLSSQPRAENFTLSTDPGLYEFLKDDFFEVMLNG